LRGSKGWTAAKEGIRREIQAAEVESHLAALLEGVESGATLVITRNGRRIARLVPEEGRHRDEADEAITPVESRGANAPRITIEEVLSARDEGRRG
jgi:prevent-host-death family protein